MQHIELCCGIGGFRRGLGLKVKTIAAVDHNEKATKNYDLNYSHPKSILGKIEDYTPGACDILTCGLPCQPASQAGRKAGISDPRWQTTLPALLRIITESKCRHFIFENVPSFRRFPKEREMITRTLEKNGLSPRTMLLRADDFGIPQKRERLFIVASKNGPPETPIPSRKRTRIADVLETDIEKKYPNYDFRVSEQRLEGLKKHRERHSAQGHGFGFRCLSTDEVFRTFVVGGMGLERNIIEVDGILRFPTPREMARAQGFDDSYIFARHKTIAYALLAEAVPPPFVSAILQANGGWFDE